MALSWLHEEWRAAEILPAGGRFARERGKGIAGSVLLHALVLVLILFVWPKSNSPLPASIVVPVQVVWIGAETEAPSALLKSAVPQERAAHMPVDKTTSPTPAAGEIPKKSAPVRDELEAKLRGLAKLHQPNTPRHALDNDSPADVDTTSDDAMPGEKATYRLRDYIKAQVLRRWSLKLSAVGNRNPTILLRVMIKRDGTVTKSEIVDQTQVNRDPAFREIAISARNAVLLSSPFALPPGDYQDVMAMTLSLKPRDTLR